MASLVQPFLSVQSKLKTADPFPANKVVFCTGGAGTICSAQVRALVHLGANACIIGRNVEKTESVAKDIATSRPGAKVIGIGAIDVSPASPKYPQWTVFLPDLFCRFESSRT